MFAEALCIIASFTAPVHISTTPASLLWLFPLAAAVVVVYKTTKLDKITAGYFLKESAILFASITVFMVATTLAIYMLVWLIME